MSRVALRLVDLDEIGEATRIAELAIDRGRSVGWAAGYDGGSRVRPIRALGRASPSAGRDRFWALLREDLDSGDFTGGTFVALGLSALVEAASDDSQLGEISDLARQHLEVLLGGVEIPHHR